MADLGNDFADRGDFGSGAGRDYFVRLGEFLGRDRPLDDLMPRWRASAITACRVRPFRAQVEEARACRGSNRTIPPLTAAF
jgi:hypothetical protein